MHLPASLIPETESALIRLRLPDVFVGIDEFAVGDGESVNLRAEALIFVAAGVRVVQFLKEELRLSRVDDSQVEITVSDTGIGIGPDFLPFVFERFRQADASFSREHGGLGLGLAITKQLIELHGGTITASSAGLGRGTTLALKLPLMIVDDSRSQPDRRAHPRTDRQVPALDTVPRLDGVHVLAVDDEPDSLTLLRTVLEGAGATVTTSASGRAALDALQQHTADVMVADIGMPDMDGLQLIRALRQMKEPLRNTPAAALTAYARSQDRITSLASGYQLHLVKPIDPIELIAAISTLAPRRLGAS